MSHHTSKYMQLNIRVLLLLCTLFAGVLCACKKNDLDEKLAEEEKKLVEYITDNYGEAAVNLGGGAWLVKAHEETDGATVEAGNYILWNLKITNQITEELEYTSELSNIKFPGSYVDGGPEITVVLSSKIDEGLIQMRKGEKGNVYIPSRWLFCDFQPRIYSVEIVDVIRDLSVYQEALMGGYIKRAHRGASADTIKNVVSTIDNTEYNVMYHICDEGKGEAITDGMNIETKTSISYMIRMNREGDIHSYQVNQDLIWNTNKINTLTKTNCVGEILKKMKTGGKVDVTMPSKLFWEDKDLPANNNDQFIIPKWSVVVFTITIK